MAREPCPEARFFLASAFALPLGEAILAIDRAVFAWLERNLAFLFAFTASRFVHFARPASESTLLKPHVSSSCWRCWQRGCGKKFPKNRDRETLARTFPVTEERLVAVAESAGACPRFSVKRAFRSEAAFSGSAVFGEPAFAGLAG